jgi:sugar phosphate isomerase/epimerase
MDALGTAAEISPMLRLATKLLPEQRAFETAYRAGFRFAEIWLGPAVLAERASVVQQARYYPNGYVLHFPNRLDLTPEMLGHVVELHRSLGCRAMVIHQPMHDKFQGELLRLEPTLRLAVENHRLTPDAFTEWAERNSGLTLDVEHVWKFTLHDAPLERLLDWVRAFLARYRDKLLHVHLPGYWPGLAEHRPMYCAREMIFPVLSLLADAGFDGLVVSEVNPQYQNEPELRMDVLLFDAWREQSASPAVT